MTAATTATKLLTDNRTVVCGKDDTAAPGVRIAILPTHADGKAFTALKADRVTPATGTANVATPTVPAYISSADVEYVNVPIDFAAVNTGLAGTGSKHVRKQLFRTYSAPKGAYTEKWCYTNSKGEPLKADGTLSITAAGSYDIAGAADAVVTPLSAIGASVTTWFQPGPVPGIYQVSERQQGASPYLGWAVKPV